MMNMAENTMMNMQPFISKNSSDTNLFFGSKFDDMLDLDFHADYMPCEGDNAEIKDILLDLTENYDPDDFLASLSEASHESADQFLQDHLFSDNLPNLTNELKSKGLPLNVSTLAGPPITPPHRLSKEAVWQGRISCSSITPIKTHPLHLSKLQRAGSLDTLMAQRQSIVSQAQTWPACQSAKPPFSFPCLIGMAMLHHTNAPIAVGDIYSFILERYPYFRTAKPGWKNSIRHNLSLNKYFVKIERTGEDARKGSLWQMVPDKVENMEKDIEQCEEKHKRRLAGLDPRYRRRRAPGLKSCRKLEMDTRTSPPPLSRQSSLAAIRTPSQLNLVPTANSRPSPPPLMMGSSCTSLFTPSIPCHFFANDLEDLQQDWKRAETSSPGETEFDSSLLDSSFVKSLALTA